LSTDVVTKVARDDMGEHRLKESEFLTQPPLEKLGVINFVMASRAECPIASKLTTPQYLFVLAATFYLLAKEVEIYALEIFEYTNMVKDTESIGVTGPMVYEDLQGAFSEEASNELFNYGMCNMKIEFKEG